MTSSPVDDFTIRPAHLSDAADIESLVEPYVRQRILLRRSIEEIGDLTRNGFVAQRDGRLIGFAAVDIYSKKLAELQCLAVAQDAQRKGIGRRLVQACIDCAKAPSAGVDGDYGSGGVLSRVRIRLRAARPKESPLRQYAAEAVEPFFPRA